MAGMVDAPLPLRIIFLDIDGVICCNSMGRLEDKKMRILQARDPNLTREKPGSPHQDARW